MKKKFNVLWVIFILLHFGTAILAQNIDSLKKTLPATTKVSLLEKSAQSVGANTSSFIWDGSVWERKSGAVRDTDIGFNAIVLSGPPGYYFKRNFTGQVNAKWFGAIGDGKTDDTKPLQLFINYVVTNGSDGYIPRGVYKTTATLNVGTDAKQSSGNSSFSIKGDGAAFGLGKNINGTRILFSGTGAQAVLAVKRSAWYFGSYEDFSLDCETVDGAYYGFLFETIGFTQHRLQGIRCENEKYAFAILKGEALNGEFVTFNKCSASNVDRFFFMASNTGQSLNHMFLHCSALIRNGGACFEIGGGDLGFGIHVIDFEASGMSTRTGYTYLINNGIGGTAIFDGGRIEHCATIVSHNVGSSNQINSITFNNIEFDGMRCTNELPFIKTTGGSGAYQYLYNSCKFNIRNYPTGFFNPQIAATDGSLFRFANCAFTGPNMFGYLPANGLGGIEFYNCNYYKVNKGSSVSSSEVIRVNKSSTGLSIGNMGQRSAISTSVWESPGIPSNLLINPDFGTSFGDNIVAPAPWKHTGKLPAFAMLYGYGDGKNKLTSSSSPSARVFTIGASSGVYQDVDAIQFSPASRPGIYQAVLLASGEGTLRISLENSLTGQEYDHFEMASLNGISQPVSVSLFATEKSNGGNLRVKIQNISQEKDITIQLLSQFVSQKALASYLNPPQGETKEFLNYWSANEDMVRIFGRLSIPHKTDITGSEAKSLPDVESDLYLSSSTERIKYFANGKWWQIPRTLYLDSPPTSQKWEEGDIVYNNHLAKNNSTIGWICTKGGMPGIWESILMQLKHVVINSSLTQAIQLFNNQYNIINISEQNPGVITLSLPSNPLDNDEIELKFIKAAKSVKYSNGNVAVPIESILPGASLKLVYDSKSFTWY